MTMRESALALARQGFAVFPIKAGAKAPPLVEGWQHVATSDVAQIESWWTQWPDANIGIHCYGLCVIDVDPKKGGFESLAVLEQEVLLESTYEVETPGKAGFRGRHIYYRCETPIRNGVDVLGRGIDVRTAGGYVLAPGSRTAAGEYRVLVDEPIARVDGAVVERVSARPDSRVGEDRSDHSTSSDGAVARATDFLRTHPVAVQGQGGDHHTFRTICRIRDFGVLQELALQSLAEWNARCDPPWEDDELAIKIANAYQYAQDAAGKLTPEALGFEIVAESTPSVAELAGTQTPPRELMHPADVTLDDILRSEYIIKGMLDRQSNAVLFGQWNVGKAQPLDEVVLTPEGWRTMGSLKVGDYVIGSAGLPVRVSGVYPQGVKEEWEVRFANGSTVRACGDHLWKVYKNGALAHVVTTEQLAVSPRHVYTRGRRSAAWNVPLCAPVNYTSSRIQLPLDPYLVGALIGDGGLTHYVGFSAGDSAVASEVAARLPNGHILRHKVGCNYQIISPRGQPNEVLNSLRLLGLFGKKSQYKTIPDLYMLAPPGDRLLLLQGLMDTDGWACKRKSTAVFFASSSRRLAEQVRELAMSLGGIARQIRTKPTSHLDSHWLTFRLPEGMNPFRLPRKADKIVCSKIKNLAVRGAARTGRKVEMQCISVAAPDQLYITRDFILTHNTFVVLDMAACIATGTPWFGRRVRRGRVLYLGYEGLRAMKKRIKALRDKYPKLGDRATPFRYEGLTLPLTHGEGVREVGEILRSYAGLHGGPPDLVIIDPLANALGGDDSDAGLMGTLNQFVVTLIKKQKCTVLRVHHSGHGNQDRARGHSSLPAGVDTEIRVTEQEIAATKQRDDVRGKLGFKLEVVQLGMDADGDPITTCTVAHVPDNALDPGLSQPQRELLDALIQRRGDGGTVSRTDINDCLPEGITPAKKREMIAVMEKKMYFHPEGKGWVIAERGPMMIFD